MPSSGEFTEDHSHRQPAVEDWPRGFGEASWWPVVTAIGIIGLYVGAALSLLSRGETPLVEPWLAPVTFVPGIGVFLVGVYGWLYHGFIRHYWQRPFESSLDLEWGMVLFLVTDVMTFAAGFVYYFFIRTGAWPPGELPPLLSSIVFVNTGLLLASSVALHVAHVGLRDGHRRRFVRFLATTFLLGALFVFGQLWEYYEFVVRENVAITSVFFSAFFGLTGLHGLHVLLGVVLLGIVLMRALSGQFSRRHHTAVATVSMYWHFVDAVWIFLIVVIYAGAAV
jgi:cytochrome c oxidase subunit 3